MTSARQGLAARNETIDVARGIGILLVVLGHNWIVTHEASELGRVIYSFHMPLFFFLSGVFLNPQQTLTRTAWQKAGSLLKPYFVVLLALAAGEALSGRGLTFDNLVGIFFATGQSIFWMPLWFLPHLFLASLFSSTLVALIGPAIGRPAIAAATLVVLLSLGIVCLRTLGTIDSGTLEIAAGRDSPLLGLPWTADLLLVSSAYLLAGHLVSDRVRNFKVTPLIGGVAVALFVLSHVLFDETMNLNYRVYGNPFISTLQALCGIYITLLVAAQIVRFARLKRALSRIASGSLFILIFHGVLQGKVTGKAHVLFPSELALGAGAGMLAATLGSLLIWEAARRVPLASFLLLDRK